jgi:hypothetical protein
MVFASENMKYGMAPAKYGITDVQYICVKYGIEVSACLQ